MSFFAAMAALFPRAKAFCLTHDTLLRRFVAGLSFLPDDVRQKTEEVYLDLYPDTTRALAEWENQFAVQFAAEQYGDTRRGILQSLWQTNKGGQTAEYLQTMLRKIDSGICVIENTPVKNPRDANSVLSCICGYKSTVCGCSAAVCGYRLGDIGFTPGVIRNNAENVYDIPVDRAFWEAYFFVCGGVVRNSIGEIVYCRKIPVNREWKSFVEYLILKIKPAHTGCIVFIEWID